MSPPRALDNLVPKKTVSGLLLSSAAVLSSWEEREATMKLQIAFMNAPNVALMVYISLCQLDRCNKRTETDEVQHPQVLPELNF